jgi:hypothetical protein
MLCCSFTRMISACGLRSGPSREHGQPSSLYVQESHALIPTPRGANVGWPRRCIPAVNTAHAYCRARWSGEDFLATLRYVRTFSVWRTNGHDPRAETDPVPTAHVGTGNGPCQPRETDRQTCAVFHTVVFERGLRCLCCYAQLSTSLFFSLRWARRIGLDAALQKWW